MTAHTNTTTATAVSILTGQRVQWGSRSIYLRPDEARALVDMLAAAGLLADPTARTEWGVACDIHDEVSEAEDREDAERIKAHHDAGMDHGHTLVRRTVTDWTVADAPAAEPVGTCDASSAAHGVPCLLERGHGALHRWRRITWDDHHTATAADDEGGQE